MNQLITKPAVIAFLVALGQVDTAAAYDSGPATLGSEVGATDYYRMTCSSGVAGDTDRLRFKIIDETPLPSDAQVLNLQVTRKGVREAASTVIPGLSKEAGLAGGNGKYKVKIDTVGTQLAGKQTYTLDFQCLNATGQATKTSPKGVSGKLKNGKKKTYLVNCARKGSAGNTDKLVVTLANTSRSGEVLTAQVLRGGAALNTTDGNEISLRGGNGDYYVSVDHTGTDPNKDNSKRYAFQGSCLNAANEVTAEPVVEQIQDQ